jgi:hypothetical protein
MKFTKRNHYNPCFWTAHWNPTYFERAITSGVDGLTARDQRVYALNVKSNKIYETTVDNLHFDKDMGVAEVTPADAMEFCKRNFPDQYDRFCRDMEKHPEAVYLDFEDILSSLENSKAYTTMREVIAKQRIEAPMDKGFLAGFVIVHWLRSHAMLNAMIEWSNELGIKKFEYFWMLKHSWGNVNYLFSLVSTIAPFRWHYYRTRSDLFPLNDSPVLIHPNSVMVALSPRLLLEIDRTQRRPESSISYSNFIAPEKLDDFRRRTIANTFREIIFGHESLLEQWRGSKEFASRHQLLADAKRYNALVAKDGSRELWQVNALANA